MDTAMRDLDQMHEQGDEEGPGRKAAMLAMAGLATVTLVFAMGVLLGGSPEATARTQSDPLAALDQAAALSARDDAPDTEATPAPTVDPAGMTFHEALVGDDRPEVEAALAQAAAEEAHLDPIAPEVPGVPGDSVIAAPVTAIAPTPTAWAPAGDVALAPSRAAIPERAVRRAQPGHDGDLTLQVASYHTKAEADIFAEALRARGHAAFVLEAQIPERGTFFRVRIGPFNTVGEAESYRATFEQEERMNTYVARRRDGEG